MQASLLILPAVPRAVETSFFCRVQGCHEACGHQPISQPEREEDGAPSSAAAHAAPRTAARRPRDPGPGPALLDGAGGAWGLCASGEQTSGPRPYLRCPGPKVQGHSGAPPTREVPGVPCVQGNRQRGPAPLEEPVGPVRPGERGPPSEHIVLNCLPVAQELADHLPAQAPAPAAGSGHPHRRVGTATPDEAWSSGASWGRETGLGLACLPPAPFCLRGTWSCPSLSPPPSTGTVQAPCPAWASEGAERQRPRPARATLRGQAGWPTPRTPTAAQPPHPPPCCLVSLTTLAGWVG